MSMKYIDVVVILKIVKWIVNWYFICFIKKLIEIDF